MEPKIGGIFGILGAIILFLSIPYAILVALWDISAKVGFSVTFEQLLTVLQEVSPGLYVAVISGIAFNVISGVLLALLSGRVMLGKGNDTIAMLMTIVGLLGSISSFALVGGIVGVIGAVLAMIGGVISSPATSLAPPEALLVAEGFIDGKDLADWIFYEDKIVVVPTASIFGFDIVLFLIVFLVVNIIGIIVGVGWILGWIWAGIIGGIASWSFKTILKNKKRRKFQGLPTEQILKASRKNFQLSYFDVISAKIIKTGRTTSLTITWNKRKGRIIVPREKLEFEQAKTLLTKLGDKISIT